MERELRELRIRGVEKKIKLIEEIINNKKLMQKDYKKSLIDKKKELLEKMKRKDREKKILKYIEDVKVKGNKEKKGREKKERDDEKKRVKWFGEKMVDEGKKKIMEKIGKKKFEEWMRNEKREMINDKKMRDGKK